MDDHLFVNLRSVCSPLVTVRKMKISWFLNPFRIRQSHTLRIYCHLGRRRLGSPAVIGAETSVNVRRDIWHFSVSVTNDSVFFT